MLKKILTKIKRIIYKPIFTIKFLLSKNLREYKKTFLPKIILLDYPTHDNLGDRAITEAEKQFIGKIQQNKDFYLFSYSECRCFNRIIKKYVSNNDVIFLQGGGFLGSLWRNEHDLVINLLKTYKKNKIIIFPQSVFFDKNDDVLKQEFIGVIEDCKDLTIFVREQNSYNFLMTLNLNCKVILSPDIVLNIDYKVKSELRNGKVLTCFRKDKEKKQNTEEIALMLKSYGYNFDETDTIYGKKVVDGRKAVYEKLDQFSQYSLVVTDRLHAMIFATVTGTPCIAFDNLSKKVSGVYEWIKHLDYVKCIEQKEFNKELTDALFSLRSYEYDRTFCEQYFEIISELVEEKDESK